MALSPTEVAKRAAGFITEVESCAALLSLGLEEKLVIYKAATAIVEQMVTSKHVFRALESQLDKFSDLPPQEKGPE